jgi:preprotein translocase subunit SecG
MLSGLLISLNILVCISLICVVLLQRSEGGAFGSGGSPTGLITARGAGDLLTRTTWVLFGIFMALSLALTLLGAHDKHTSSVLDKLKGQIANPNALAQKPVAPPPVTPTVPVGAPGSPFSAPPITQAPAPLVAPAPATAPPPAAAHGQAQPAKPGAAKVVATKPAAGKPAAVAAPPAAAAQPAPPVLIAPPPQPAPAPVTHDAAPPKTDPNAPVTTGSQP